MNRTQQGSSDAMRVCSLSCRQVNMATPLNSRGVWRQGALVCVLRWLFVGIGAFALISASGIPGAQAQSLEEHDVKAAFVLKLMNFVQWPSEARGRDLIIGFIGADATSDALQRQAAGQSINGRRVVVRRLGVDDDLKACQVIFVGASERKNTPTVLERLRGASVLTVGEFDGFGQHGGIINLVVNDGRIHFEVNPHAAEQAHLQISSRLLSLATIVAGGS
jgi:YfiR/HmsC-like